MMPKQTKQTRTSGVCPIFGNGDDLWHRQLPTYESIMKYYLFIRHSLKQDSCKDPSVSEIAKYVVDKLKEIWKTASIPVVTNNRIEAMLKSYHVKYRNILKPRKGRMDTKSYSAKIEAFRCEAQSKLFDIASCKCKMLSNCSCLKERRVPKEEHSFLLDQRNDRKMAISGVDLELSKKKASAMLRKQREQGLLHSTHCTGNVNTGSGDTVSGGESMSEEEENEDAIYPEHISYKRQLKKEDRTTLKKKKTKHLQTLASACDRAGVSDRAAALIATSLLQDIGAVSAEDTVEVVDRNKVRRARQKKRSSICEIKEQTPITGIYFDGRKDMTLTQEKKGEKYYRRKELQEHITLVKEPGSEYLGHYSVKRGSAEEISTGLFEYTEDNSIDLKNLIAVGCDGTAVNTGEKGGAIRLIERKLNKAVHHFICQLHANELPLRHLVEKLDGKTSGPHGFTGPIGKQLNNCEKLPIVTFDKIDAEEPTVTVKDLSTDQKYLLEIHQAVTKGYCPEDLAHRNPGKMAHSRWVTTANRLLRLYISTKNPSQNLLSIVLYIMKVYVPMWFSIKQNPSFVNGPKHVFKTIELTRTLDEEVRHIAFPVIQRNAFFGHPENVLASMIDDNSKEIRELAWRRIKKARQMNKEKTLRYFSVPSLNFDAKHYTELIDWQKSKITEPPLTKPMTGDNIESNIVSKSRMTLPSFPCHTQAVERMIKEVTDASVKVCGNEARHGYIKSRLESRAKMPYFESKAHFKV